MSIPQLSSTQAAPDSSGSAPSANGESSLSNSASTAASSLSAVTNASVISVPKPINWPTLAAASASTTSIAAVQLGKQAPGVLVAGLLDRELVVAGVDGFEDRIGLGDHLAPFLAVGDADLDVDRVGHLERRVLAVADLHAQRMIAGFQVDRAFRSAVAEVHVVGVASDRRPGLGTAGIGDHVEVPGAGVDLAGGLDLDPVGRHRQRDPARQAFPVARRLEADHRRLVSGVVAAAGEQRQRRRRHRQQAVAFFILEPFVCVLIIASFVCVKPATSVPPSATSSRPERQSVHELLRSVAGLTACGDVAS